MKHIVESQQFDIKTINRLFKIADSFEKKKRTPLKGKILASLFYEPSTRTRFSFESAMLRLGGSVISTENAHEFSSAAKGETLEDTVRVINEYADVIVLRHFELGASERAARVSRVPIVNAGDGPGQHPTQALLDLYTIKRKLGKIDGVRIAFVGDLKNGRTVRSLAYLLGKYKKIKLYLISPKELQIGKDIKEYFERHGVEYTELQDWNSVLGEVDVVYQTRIQKERFASEKEYKKFKGKYVLTLKEVGEMKKGSIIMHPLPRVDEISADVDSTPHAAYFTQAKYGVLVRMALLVELLGS
jgi:aspartate carbamoyltransferase catalytic subunit